MKRPASRPIVVPVALSEVKLPATPFLYTVDQIAILINKDARVMRKEMHFIGRSLEMHSADRLQAMNIALPDNEPEWRVSETEFMRWLVRKGYQPTKLHF